MVRKMSNHAPSKHRWKVIFSQRRADRKCEIFLMQPYAALCKLFTLEDLWGARLESSDGDRWGLEEVRYFAGDRQVFLTIVDTSSFVLKSHWGTSLKSPSFPLKYYIDTQLFLSNTPPIPTELNGKSRPECSQTPSKGVEFLNWTIPNVHEYIHLKENNNLEFRV